MTNVLADAVFVAVIVYCLVATFGDVRRITTRHQKGWSQFRVTSRGRDQVFFGLVLGASLLFLGWGHVRTRYQMVGWCVGVPLGVIFGFSVTAKWKRELQEQQCSPLEIRRKTIEISTLIFLFIALFVLGPLLPDRFPIWLTETCMVMGGALSTFLIASGVYTWAWGKGQEHAGFRPFEIRVQRSR